MGQHHTSIGWTSVYCWVRRVTSTTHVITNPQPSTRQKKTCPPDAGLLLAHIPRPRANIKQTLYEYLIVFVQRIQGFSFESCVWRPVSSHSSHHPQKVLLAQFSLYVHKSSLKPDLFHFIFKATLCLMAFYRKIVWTFFSGRCATSTPISLWSWWSWWSLMSRLQ